jgi:hypothetical protein
MNSLYYNNFFFSIMSNPYSFAGVLFAINVVIAFSIACCLIEMALKTLARWKIYEKAGVASWKCLIPFYNQYNDVKLAWNETWAYVYLFSAIGTGLLSGLASATQSVAFEVVSVLACIFILVIHIIYCVKLSKAFGHAGGWAVGLIFLDMIFMLMIALGKSHYKKGEAPAAPAPAPAAEEAPQA